MVAELWHLCERFPAQICHAVLTWGPGHCPGQTAQVSRGGRSPLGLPGAAWHKELECRRAKCWVSWSILQGWDGKNFSKEGLCVSPVQHLVWTRGGRGREGRGPAPLAAAGVSLARQHKNWDSKLRDSKDSRSSLLVTCLDPVVLDPVCSAL